MRRGAKPSKAKVESKRPAAPKSPKTEDTTVRDLEKQLAQALKSEAEALEQQTATAEILRVIASSPTSVEAVFDTILANALRLCDTPNGGIFTFDGQAFHVAAAAHWADEFLASLREEAILPGPETPLRRVGLDLRPSHVADIFGDPSFSPPEIYRREGMRTSLAVPMLKEGRLVGALTFHRREVRPFTEKQIALIETFADQAVIAIENVRLFTELQEKNSALTQAHAQVSESLEQQTATAEVLKVISRSTFDLQPVLDTVIENAARLCKARRGIILRREGDSFHGVAFYNASAELVEFIKSHPVTPGRQTITARVALERRTIHVADIQADPEYRYALRDIDPIRTELGVPMFRGNEVLGVIILYKLEIDPFTDNQIGLVETFADQAVIAIENVRLFTELQASNRELRTALDTQTATSDILSVISRSQTDVQPVFDAIAQSAMQLCGAFDVSIFRVDGERLAFVAHHGPIARLHGDFWLPLVRGTVGGRSVLESRVIQVADLQNEHHEFPEAVNYARQFGFRTILSVPLLREGVAIGGIQLRRSEVQLFSDQQIALLKTFADQAVIAIENVRLFNELQLANHDLKEASQHKSEFLANMSHELRTPLNAVIGFSEVLSDRMFGELNEKQDEYLKDIHASGQHLLSLINDILDLSKIEAGRMELELSDFSLPATLENALTLGRERASRRGLGLDLRVDERLDQIRADERKVRQVVLNLLSNAIKFTPEGGRIEIRAAAVDGDVEVSIADTGVGIAPEDQEAIFEEFRQVGTASKKVEGTGLGLALSRKFIELHGGRIWVKSQVGQGSTFTFTLPARHGE